MFPRDIASVATVFCIQCGAERARKRQEPPARAPGARLAAQLTQGWTQSIWGRVERLLADGEPQPLPDRRPTKRRQLQRRLTTDQVTALITDYESGLSIQKLAAKYTIRHETVSRWLQVNNVTLRPTKAAGIPKDRLAEAQTLRTAGWSYRKIGNHFGCSDTIARKTLLRLAAQDRDETPPAA